jgi:RNA polymerase sigma-70 factor (sigma-E family)
VVDAGAEEFASFVAAREGALQRTAWLLTGDWALAQDLVQTALAKSWPRWDRITRRDDPEIYVRRVMLNTWMTWRRRSWRGERASEQVPETPAPGDLAADVTARLAARQLLAVLTDRQRTVLVLRIFDDLSEAQVAQVLDCAVGTVKSTMSQALAKLRDQPHLVELMEREAR